MVRLLLGLLALAVGNAHAQCWEYTARISDFDQEMVGMELQAGRLFGGAPESINPWAEDNVTHARYRDFLNELGADGWELVQIGTTGQLPLYFLKRETDCATPPP